MSAPLTPEERAALSRQIAAGRAVAPDRRGPRDGAGQRAVGGGALQRGIPLQCPVCQREPRTVRCECASRFAPDVVARLLADVVRLEATLAETREGLRRLLRIEEAARKVQRHCAGRWEARAKVIEDMLTPALGDRP